MSLSEYWTNVRWYEKQIGEGPAPKCADYLQCSEDRKDYLDWLKDMYEVDHQYDNISIEAAWDMA